MRFLAVLLNAVVVGLGHVIVDRHLIGFVHFVCFAIFADGMVVAYSVMLGEGNDLLFLFASIGAAGMWIYSMSTLLHSSFFQDADKQFNEMAQHYLSGVKLFYDSKYHEARQELQAVLAIDRKNMAARLMIASSYCQQQHFGRARAILRDCSRLDKSKHWSSEIQKLLQVAQGIAVTG